MSYLLINGRKYQQEDAIQWGKKINIYTDIIDSDRGAN